MTPECVIMGQDAKMDDVIDLSSDEENCCEEQAIAADCGLSDGVENTSLLIHSSRQINTTSPKGEQVLRKISRHSENERWTKEERIGSFCFKPSRTEQDGVPLQGQSIDLQERDAGTDGTSPSRIPQVQDRKAEFYGREAFRERACNSLEANSTTFLGSSCIKYSPTANSQQKQISRRFWKAGDYEVQASSTRRLLSGMDHVRVHPKFLHSNATSHKWALGAIAELLDNAIDEVQNGATFVSVKKVVNPPDNNPALLIQDDGGGMDPECMRQCLSLGYSRKTTNATIGQYGNGFKTSTMRLGADVIVFSRCSHNRSATQSIGLLSYTFLRATEHEDIVVPMVDFELTPNGVQPKMLIRTTEDDWLNNLSTVLQWSPYTTEAELLNQFDDLGWHGTKIVVYNLWLNDDGDLELDFDTDKKDIQLRGIPKLDKADTLQKQLSNEHIANRLRYSLRAYASVLYLRMPSNFQILLRGELVQHLSIEEDLKFPERILYKPQIGNSRDGSKEVSVITTIGFAKEAPMVSVHGFNVYHKNRLIMPFWKVFHDSSSRGRGVVGVLEANFIEPAHDKQDFEKTPMLQRLETRLKQMTIEYWNLHCELIGYQAPRQPNRARYPSSNLSGSPGAFPAIQSVTSQVEAHPQSIMATGIPSTVVGAVASYSSPCFLQSRDQITSKLLQFPPLSWESTGTAEMSSLLFLSSMIAQRNFNPKYAAPSHLDMMVDTKPSISGSNGADLNQLHSGFSCANLAMRTDEQQNGLLQARPSNSASDVHLTNGLRKCIPASAPSTPPQPGSDAGALCKPMDSALCEKTNANKMFNCPQNEDVEDAVNIQVTISSKDDEYSQRILGAKVKVEAKNTVLVKRSALETCSMHIGGDLKRHNFSTAGQIVREIDGLSGEHTVSAQTPISSLKLVEVMEEVEQLRLRCALYEHREKELEFKVTRLQHELLDAQSEYKKLLVERESLKMPKKES